MNVGRVAAMKAGLPIEVQGRPSTVLFFRPAGHAMAAERVMCGFADCIVAGGVESMSCVPLGGLKYSANPGMMVDWPEAFASMGVTAEQVAERYGIDRLAMDTFAVASNAKAAAAIAAGRFTDEIIPVEIEKNAIVGGKLKRTKEMVLVDDGVAPAPPQVCWRSSGFKVGGPVPPATSQMTDGAAVALVFRRIS
jgi:acetyl-CoA acyltransferase